MFPQPVFQKLCRSLSITPEWQNNRELTAAASMFPPLALTHLLMFAIQVGTAQLVSAVGTLLLALVLPLDPSAGPEPEGVPEDPPRGGRGV
jgi:hypothetical protein